MEYKFTTFLPLTHLFGCMQIPVSFTTVAGLYQALITTRINIGYCFLQERSLLCKFLFCRSRDYPQSHYPYLSNPTIARYIVLHFVMHGIPFLINFESFVVETNQPKEVGKSSHIYFDSNQPTNTYNGSGSSHVSNVPF
jgi:hypothetical protein